MPVMRVLGFLLELLPLISPIVVALLMRRVILQSIHRQDTPAPPIRRIYVTLADGVTDELLISMVNNYPRNNHYLWESPTLPYTITYDPYTRYFTIRHGKSGTAETYHIEDLQNFHNSDTDVEDKLIEKIQDMHDKVYPAQALRRKLGIQD